MIPRTEAELRVYKKRLAELKAKNVVRTHRLGSEEEVAGVDRRAASPQPRQGANGGKAVPEVVQAKETPQKPGKRSKHGAVKVYLPGGKEKFDSKLEYRVWLNLKFREKAGEIKGLRRQVTFALFISGGEWYSRYTADFVWLEATAEDDACKRVVADAKSKHTRKLPAWQKVKLLMKNCHGIDVLELP